MSRGINLKVNKLNKENHAKLLKNTNYQRKQTAKKPRTLESERFKTKIKHPLA